MRIIFTLLLLATLRTSAQSPFDICKSTEEIAAMERRGHERITNRGNATLPSANFDVKYYRLEWEVDPPSVISKEWLQFIM
jgi:hypothetical protein